MATTIEEIYVKVGVNTEGFDKGLAGIKKEIRELSNAKLNILSDEERRAVSSRIAKLKDELGDFKQSVSNVEPFQVLNRAVGSVSAGFSAAASTLKLFGVENAKLNKAIEISNVVMTASIALQNLKDLANLRSAASEVLLGTVEKRNIIQRGLYIAVTKIATAVQWAWNAAMTANPIGAVITAIVALVAIVVALTRVLSKNTDETNKNALSKEDYAKAVEDSNKRIMDSEKKLNDFTKQTFEGRLGELAKLQEEEQAARDAALQLRQDSYQRAKLDRDQGVIGEAEYGEKIKKIRDAYFYEVDVLIPQRYKEKRDAINAKYDQQELDDLQKKNDEAKAKRIEAQNENLELVSDYYDQEIALAEARGEDTFPLEEARLKHLIALNEEYGSDTSKLYDELILLQTQYNEESKKKAKEQSEEQKKEAAKYAKDTAKVELDIRASATDFLIAQKDKEIEKLSNSIQKGVDDEDAANAKLKQLYIERGTLVTQATQIKVEAINLEIAELQKTYDERVKLTAGVSEEELTYYLALIKQYEEQKKQIIAEGEANAVPPAEEDPVSLRLKEQISSLQALALATQAAGEAINMILDYNMEIFNQNMESQLEQIDAAYAQETESLDQLLRNQAISQQEYNKRKEKLDQEKAAKEAKLKKEQAKKEKEANIIKAIINTAVGVTQALASSPPPLSFVLAGITAALGALEIALIASKPIPEYKKGGVVRKMATGGYLTGPSHAEGGIPLYAEGGEFIVNKTTTAKPGMLDYLNQINNNQTQPGPATAVINRDDLKSLIAEVISIPVQVVETDITTTQRKVSTIEVNATW